MESIVLEKDSNLLKLPEQLYGTIKRVGMINKEPILYGDVNMLKLNDLYYILGAKQVYRLVKIEISNNQDDQGGGTRSIAKGPLSKGSGSSILYTFDTIKQTTSLESLLIPEEERGKIRNAGYLFNEIIYSGDANLIDNGSLFYHDTLPFISVVSNVDGTINLSTKAIIDGDPETIVTEYRVSPEPHDYSKDYFTIKAITDTEFGFYIPSELVTNELVTEVYYKINDSDWTSFDKGVQNELKCELSLPSGDVIQFKGIAERYAGLLIVPQDESPEEFFSNIYFEYGEVKVYGNILSLFYGDDFYNSDDENYPDKFACAGLFKDNDVVDKIDCSNLILSPYTAVGCYYNMFAACEGVIIPPELPATTLTEWCYQSMFSNCTSLTTVPELPATTLASSCYQSMFYGCTSLTTAPVLPATTLAQYCYNSMFYNCISLTTAPELPATTLTKYCYRWMFLNCTSLTTAPELPATTLVQGCYSNMFYNCSSLNYIKAMFTTTPSNTYTQDWVAYVAATGTFVKNNVATWNVTGNSGVPTGWTVETA